jgi:hypothetical protein
MEELPTTLSPEQAAAIVALVEGPRLAVAGGLAFAFAAGAATFLATGRLLVAAIAWCVAFPLAARLLRALRLGWMRRYCARRPERAAELAAAAWAKASPGQRAALQMLVKKSA